MSNILLVGVGPLPDPKQPQVYAPGLRLLTMLRGLDAEEHTCSLVEMPFGTLPVQKSVTQIQLKHHMVVPPTADAAMRAINTLCEKDTFDAIVALTDLGALAAAQSNYGGPLWVDYFGHPAAERQQQAFRHNSNEAIAEMWKTTLPVLLRADHFSVCSKAQRLALVGELGAAGRLNAQSCGHEFVTVIPPAIAIDREPIPHFRGLLQSHDIPREARVMLVTGGMNTWFDDETFFAALEKTMMFEEDVYLVVTGGTIGGHSTIVYERFRKRVEASPLKNRIVFMGWLAHDDFLAVCSEAHVAISCDLKSLEGELGCRNRVLGWLWMGLRVVTTALDEHTQALADMGLIHTYRWGESRDLSDAILAEFKLPRRTPVEVASLRQKLGDMHLAERLAAPLARWANTPKCSPDRLVNGSVSNPLTELQRVSLGVELPDPNKELLAQVAAGRELAMRLQGSRAFNMYFGGKPEIRELLEKVLQG
jgi:hypothetical protein